MKTFSGIITEQFQYSEGFLEALKEVGLGVYKIEEDAWLGKWGRGDREDMLLLEDEKSLKEFRVTLGKYFTKKEVEDNWDITSREEYIEKYGENDDDLKRFEEDIAKIGNITSVTNSYSDAVEFSVFLPNNVKFHDKDDSKYDIFVAACLTQAAVYFKGLKETIKETYTDPILENNFEIVNNNPKKFGIFLDIHKIKISNYNIDVADDVVYRLYKDSKFFYNLKEVLNSDYEWLMKEFSKIVG